MPSLLITVFVIQLVIHIINTIGASTINDLVFSLYLHAYLGPAAN
jgi:hypothetical protein